MKDRLVTVLISVLTTVVVMSIYNRPHATTAIAAESPTPRELVVDRLIVRHELIVSDTGEPWEKGFEKQEIPRGLYAKSTGGGVGAAGLWVRGRLIKTEIDDPFDDRFHAINRDGSMFRAPGHISWNVWLGDHWRQVAIIQGETLENSEVSPQNWSGGNHPGRLRFQSFRPNHDEPLTDATIGQGMMSLGGGGYGGEGLPYASEVLQLWGGKMAQSPVATPAAAPRIVRHDGSGKHTYALIAVGPQGQRSSASPKVTADGRATLAWDSVRGADAYVIERDGKPLGDVLRIEGARKQWTDDGR
jgi:hypothetical protein